ncbi:MAG: BACON domain-containing protein [Prevotellaceae bacterium]|jgi:hypothetical protein|nr:BACON domain-containing protein [Prevotellaceae bacterium]
MYKYLFFSLLLSLSVLSCKDKDKDKTPSVTLEVAASSNDSINFTGGEVEVTVTTTGRWEPTSAEDWISFEPLRGTGNGKFKIIAAANPVEAARTATVSVSISENPAAKKELKVVQKPKSVNWTFTRKGLFKDLCVGSDAAWKDWGDHGTILYKECLLEADGVLTLNTDYRLHYILAEKEPGYIEFVDIMQKSYKNDFTKPKADGDIWVCRTSDKYIGEKPSDAVAADCGEYWDHGRGKTKATYTFHLKAGTYWLIATRAGLGQEPQSEYVCGQIPETLSENDCQYPIDVPVDEVYTFVKD